MWQRVCLEITKKRQSMNIQTLKKRINNLFYHLQFTMHNVFLASIDKLDLATGVYPSKQKSSPACTQKIFHAHGLQKNIASVWHISHKRANQQDSRLTLVVQLPASRLLKLADYMQIGVPTQLQKFLLYSTREVLLQSRLCSEILPKA